MFKNRKAVSKLLAAVMAIGMLPAFSIAANAEDATETVTWGGGYTIDFDEMTTIVDTDNIKFHSAESPTLVVDGENGKYLSLINKNTSYSGGVANYTAGQWGAAVVVDNNDDADYVKISYKAMVNQPASDTTSSWGSSSVADKVVWYGKGTTTYVRSWGVRACVNQTQFFGGTAATSKKIPTGEWVDVEYVYNASDYTTSAKISQNGVEINSATYTTQRGPLQLLLLAARGGNETYPVYYDDITVSYGTIETATEAPTTEPTVEPTEAPTTTPTEAPTEAPTTAPTEAPTEVPTEVPTEAPTPAPVAEDFTLTFDGASAVPADTAVVTYNENISAVENDALKITGNDGNGAVIINIIESDANAVAVEFDAKLATLDAYSTEVPWKGYDGIHTKLKPTSGNRFYAVRLSPVLVQLYGTTQQEHPCVDDWYHVKHVWDKATKTLYTTVSADGAIIISDIKTGVAGIAQYNLGTDTAHTCLYDNIKVSYLDDTAEYATFAREVQFDPSDVDGKGTLRFKAGVTDAVANGAGAGFAFVNFAANNGSVVSLDEAVTNEAVAEGDVFYYDVTGLETATITGEAEVIYTAGFYAVPYLSDGVNKYYGMPFTFTGNIVSEDGAVVTQTK